jgi:hypothetical protein
LPQATVPHRAFIGTYALILAESVRATDDLARAHGAELLGLPELAFLARAIGAAAIGRELPAADLDHLNQLFVRASDSAYVTFAGAKRWTEIQKLLAPPEGDIATASNVSGEPTPVASSTSPPRITLPVPDLSGVRHRSRPMKTAGPIRPELSAAQPGSETSSAPRPAQVRHRARPVTPGGGRPLGSADAC